MPLQIKRGTNISHWLSQSEERGEARRAYFTRTDVRRIADWGFDHIRLPIDEVQLWDEQGRQEPEGFDLLDQALDWCAESGLKTVVDFHILRSHFFMQSSEPALFADPAEGAKFVELWKQLSERLNRRPVDQVAYELMNEPVALDADNWNRVALPAFRALRQLEPKRTIVLGSNRWNSVLTYDMLEVPDDPEMILTFHYYLPMFVTHHRAWWCPEGKMYEGPVQYPGRPVPAEHVGEIKQGPDFSAPNLVISEVNKHYDRFSMVSDMSKPLAMARRKKLPLYCGEFGVIDLTPQPVRLAWLADLISVFAEYDIAWANWDYKEEFGIFDRQGNSTGLAEVLLGKDPGCGQ